MSASIDKLNTFLSKYDNIVLTTHESPDGDGLGAEIGFKELLVKMGKNAIILNGDPTPDKYKFFDIDNELSLISEENIPENIKDYGLVVLDTNDFDNTGNTYRLLKDRVDDVLVIDHHESDIEKANDHIIMSDASSASEIVANIYFHFYDEMTLKAAQALYTGILFDTGSFRYPKTSSKTFRTIATLMEHGASPTLIYEKLYENNLLANLLLKTRIMSSMEIHFDNKMILMHLTPEDISETGGNFSEGETCINVPLTIEGVEASVLIKEDIEGPLKVSMRTRGDRDVARIALDRNGGGHKNAAGYKSNLNREETRLQVLADMKAFFQ